MQTTEKKHPQQTQNIQANIATPKKKRTKKKKTQGSNDGNSAAGNSAKSSTTNKKANISGKNSQDQHKPLSNLSTHKLIVRKLPPSLSAASFLDQIYKLHPELSTHILSHYYVQGEYPENPYLPFVNSRCYLECDNEQSLMAIGKTLKVMKLKDDNSNEDSKSFEPTIEKAIFNAMPPTSISVGAMNKTIGDLPLFKLFQDYCNSTGQFEKKEGNNQNKTVPPTDLLEYLDSIISKSNKKKKKKKNKNATPNDGGNGQKKDPSKEAAKAKKEPAKKDQLKQPIQVPQPQPQHQPQQHKKSKKKGKKKATDGSNEDGQTNPSPKKTQTQMQTKKNIPKANTPFAVQS